MDRRDFQNSPDKSCGSWANVFGSMWNLNLHQIKDGHGFSDTGQFHTIKLDPKNMTTDLKGMIALHYQNEESSKLDFYDIQLFSERPEVLLLYDARILRWFSISNTSNGQNLQVRITSGSVRDQLSRKGEDDDIVIIDEYIGDDHNVLLTYGFQSKIHFSSLKHLDTFGDFMVLLIGNNDGSFVLDIIKYDTDQTNHYKRVIVRKNTIKFNREGLKMDIFIDFLNDRFYVTELRNKFNLIHGFDFCGHCLFTKDLLKEKTRRIRHISQIDSSKMVIVWIGTKDVLFEVETFHLMETGPVRWKKFNINVNIESNYWRSRIFENSGKFYFMVTTGSRKYREEFIFIYNILTGVNILEHKANNRNDIYDFNRNGFQEVAMLCYDFTDVDDFYEYPGDIYYHAGDDDPREKILSIDVENVSYKAKSLKNQARLACLKSFDETYLKEKLHANLKIYLGLVES